MARPDRLSVSLLLLKWNYIKTVHFSFCIKTEKKNWNIKKNEIKLQHEICLFIIVKITLNLN